MTNPTVGQLTVVRGRPAVIRDVVQNRAREGNFHLISVQYVDGTTFPDEEWISWENESEPQLLSGITFPGILNSETLPDKPSRYSSFINAYRWTSHNRLTSSRAEQDSVLAIISPWYNAVQIEDYQLYPVIKSLLMPRVSLLLADDVGLGKTIEAGLILSELYSRRRIHRTLVVCPASLQRQWKDELLVTWVEKVLPKTRYTYRRSPSETSLGEYINSKFTDFVFDPRLRLIFGQPKSTISLKKIMDNNKITANG